jgi:hypothetical protein
LTLPSLGSSTVAVTRPGEQWKTEPSRLYDKFIEVQVWDDRPIWSFLQRLR